jgi:hypothetical protein
LRSVGAEEMGTIRPTVRQVGVLTLLNLRPTRRLLRLLLPPLRLLPPLSLLRMILLRLLLLAPPYLRRSLAGGRDPAGKDGHAGL